MLHANVRSLVGVAIYRHCVCLYDSHAYGCCFCTNDLVSLLGGLLLISPSYFQACPGSLWYGS